MLDGCYVGRPKLLSRRASPQSILQDIVIEQFEIVIVAHGADEPMVIEEYEFGMPDTVVPHQRRHGNDFVIICDDGQLLYSNNRRSSHFVLAQQTGCVFYTSSACLTNADVRNQP